MIFVGLALSVLANIFLLAFLYHIRKRAPLTTDALNMLREILSDGALVKVQHINPEEWHIFPRSPGRRG